VRRASLLHVTWIVGLAWLLLSGCAAGAVPIVPTARPTATPTPSPAPTATRDRALPTITPTRPIATAGGPTGTPLFGAPLTVATAGVSSVVGIVAANPNAPRIEFFTADASAVPPGGIITLYWSTRNVSDAVIYQIVDGARSRLWNVGADGSLPVQTRRADRGVIDFVLSVGDGVGRAEQPLSIPLACPDVWFFSPAPNDCPTRPAEETQVIEQSFERGRMVYIGSLDRVYALFNDSFDPAWVVIDNRYDPAIHPPSEPSFPVPPGFFQPTNELGFVWRGNDLVRSRLGLGAQPEQRFTGVIQIGGAGEGGESLYVGSADGAVLAIAPGGALWEIITPPS